MKLFRGVILIIFLVCAVAAQDFKTVQEGVEYAQFTRQVKINDKETAPVVVNALRLDLKRTRLDVVHAMDAAIGTEKTSSIATRHGAFAAINAGFFRLDKSIFAGEGAGVLQVDGKLLSESYGDRITMGIINEKDKTNIRFEHLKAIIFLSYSGNITKTLGINRERKPDEAVAYTPEFGKTPITSEKIYEIVLSNCVYSCQKVTVIESNGGTPIPKEGYVIVANHAAHQYMIEYARKQSEIKSPSDLSVVKLLQPFGNTDFNSKKKKWFERAEDIIAGVPQLIKNSKLEITWEQEKSSKSFVETRHPRTAVAKLKDGKALLVTVDGRQPGVSAGMNLQELAEILLEMGATDAMNLDGGGSTTMFLDGKVVNKPSDREGERAVSDAILVTLRKTK